MNDSDSAIIIDVAGEVSLPVPTLLPKTEVEANPEAVKVIRSVSDVVKSNEVSTSSETGKPLNGRKTKEERRISNRQKLLALKRHSGYLKRPEILETVYR